MTTGGGTSYGDDYVQARLSVEVPEASIQGIREITQETERFRTTMEASIRATADYSRYLDQMAEAHRRVSEAQRELINHLQMSSSLMARGSMAPFSPAVPTGGYAAPFAGAIHGMGTTGMGYRPPDPADVAYQIANLPLNDPRSQRQYINMQQQHGNVSAADMMSLSSDTVQDLATKIAQRETAVRDQGSKTDGNTDSKAAPSGTGSGVTGEGINARIQRASTLAGQVMNEIGPGGSTLGVANLAVRGLNWAARRSAQAGGRPPTDGYGGAEDTQVTSGQGGPAEEGAPIPQSDDSMAEDKASGGFGGILKMLGPIAGVATAALSVFGLVEKGGGMIQGMRNVASVRGGAAGEGAEVEFKARMMAMNPFISQDQARQIYQAVMSEGYADASGAGADNVIDFMKSNLTTMNVSVAESAKMLRQTIVGNVSGDPQSVAGSVSMLNQELNNIRTLSGKSTISQPDYRNAVMAMQSGLVNLGGSNQMSAQAAMLAEEVGSQDLVTRGQFAAGASDLSGSLQGQMSMRIFGGVQVPGGLLPGMTTEYLTDNNELPQAAWNTMRHYALQAKQSMGDRTGSGIHHENAVYIFQQYVKRLFPDMDAAKSIPAAKAMYEQLLGNQEFSAAQQRESQVPEIPSSGGSGGADFSPGTSMTTPSPSPAPPQITSPSGVPLTGSYAGGGGGSGGETNVSGNVRVDLTPQAAQLLQLMGGNNVRLTPNQMAANAGLAAQVNTPPMGQG